MRRRNDDPTPTSRDVASGSLMFPPPRATTVSGERMTVQGLCLAQRQRRSQLSYSNHSVVAVLGRHRSHRTGRRRRRYFLSRDLGAPFAYGIAVCPVFPRYLRYFSGSPGGGPSCIMVATSLHRLSLSKSGHPRREASQGPPQPRNRTSPLHSLEACQKRRLSA
jgi:hypothetical protein